MASSRPSMTATIQADAMPICTSDTSAAVINNLSASGSHELSQVRDLVTAARQIAVQPVRNGGKPEDRGADELLGDAEYELGLESRQEDDDEERHQEDAGQRQRVGQVHRETRPLARVHAHSTAPAGTDHVLANDDPDAKV